MINQTATLINKLKIASSLILLFLISSVLGINLTLPILLFSFYLYLKSRNLLIEKYRLLYLVFLFVINLASSYFIIRYGYSKFYIPFSLVPMLSVILFKELEVSFILSLASSITIASLAGNNFYLGVLFLISATVSSLLVFGARKRTLIIRAGFITGLIQAAVLWSMHNFVFSLPVRYLILFLNGIVSSIIVMGILPVFEYLFKTVTNISLLELVDFNHPLLQRLVQEAPGTYHHSLMVGNLSDAASRIVGANTLLARVGAYYHDIGKLEKAEYFSENQGLEVSKHDTLSPTMSKMVIMNHVKVGLELARKYKLNARLMDFILQHHGNSLVYYFYRRALENLEDDQEIKEEGFRYPGPKPNSKETAIVLLADSVEAAARGLKEPNAAKIAEVVHKIINNKFIDGQLDECDLTLKDLEKIAGVFIRILGGIYHTRTTYPESSRKSEDNHKKSTKETHPKSQEDKADNL